MNRLVLILVGLMLPYSLLAQPKSKYSIEEIRDLINTMFKDNAEYVEQIAHEPSAEFPVQQSPRATVVSCSDSRVQSRAFHKSPVDDLFMIRNIGNQIKTASGSVEYGIYHLHTPILLIMGHSQCGAIASALSDYRRESVAIKHELVNLNIKEGSSVEQGVIENVNNQVKYALKKYDDKIKKKELIILGTIFDFRDELGHGHGRLILINLNGETDPKKIQQNDYIKGFEHISIGTK